MASVGKELAVQACGPEFGYQQLQKSLGTAMCVYNSSLA